MTYIYILERNNVPFYVGKTNTLHQRRSHHKKHKGDDLIFTIIDEVDDIKWKFWEYYWISQFITWGFKLENKNQGGGGPTSWTEEQRDKINPQRIERIKNNKDRGNKISKTLLERDHSKYYTDEVKGKISKALKDKPKEFSKEHLFNLSKANLESKGKIVECYNMNDEYIIELRCLREAKEWLLEQNSNISQNVDKQIKDCCNGRQKTCHGYKFKYKE